MIINFQNLISFSLETNYEPKPFPFISKGREKFKFDNYFLKWRNDAIWAIDSLANHNSNATWLTFSDE